MLNQELSNNQSLTVYKASAGSGKTHQLTGEYIRLLFNYPSAYKHILAVTFTNKATEEMKSRIIEELANLSSNRKSDYLKSLCRQFSKDEDWIRAFARKILVNILHDYSSFSVSTIDRFFQQTMRAFTREIGLGGGYNVELDTGKVLSEAIDSMLYELERSDNKQLLDWLIRFSEEKIENGETWNIRSDIQSLSTEIFKESYKAFSDDIQTDIADKSMLDDYKKMLLTSIAIYEKRSVQIAEKAMNIMTRHNLVPDSFKGGSKSAFLSFPKWLSGEIKEPTNTFLKLESDITNWYTKTTPESIKSAIEEAYNDGLNDCISDIIAHYQNKIAYQTASEINRYFFTLGILGDVDKNIRVYAAENNTMLISDTTELLSKIIQGTDTPFVYEKVGTRIDNYMIDEFQDTSSMQWNNFLPLLKDSLSAGNKNLIVGDVKQSIYRWRNSDWKLLDEQIDKDFSTYNIDHQSLDINWRSLSNVVHFNNAVFKSAPLLLQNLFNSDLGDTSNVSLSSRIVKAYDTAYQHIPIKQNKSDNGYVKVEFVDTEEYSDWHDYVLENLPKEIEKLQDRGYSLKDIAILVRSKKEGAEVANCLLEYKGKNVDSKYRYDIISDEALFLRNAKSIKLIVSLFRYLKNPADFTLRTMAIYEYFKFKDELSPEETIESHFSGTDDFPSDVKINLERIRELPLYEMTEELFDLFSDAMDKNEHIYMQAFLDLVLDFSTNKSSDLDSFLQWWDESKSKQTIFTPDGQDAIRIMTIHKSKGLGFKAVILPFCNWEIDHKPTQLNILWCQPKIEPFNMLKLVPVKYSSKLKDTIFSYEYYDERLHAFIDNLNLLYVAFTRAKDNLFVFAPRPKDESKIDSVSSLLWSSLHHQRTDEDQKEFITTQDSFNENSSFFELGIQAVVENKSVRISSDKEIEVESLPSIPFDNRLKLRMSNKYFFTDQGKREYGNLMHEIVSKVNHSEDLESIVQEYLLRGDITEKESLSIINNLIDYFSNEDVAIWYSGYYKVLNEVQILQPNGTFIRPDRVMMRNQSIVVVDYKFGEKEDKKYLRQVKNYMSQIRKMGYSDVKGFLSYVVLGKVVEVS